ncbi:MAG: MATE family efflux transporter [Lentisphaeria bacterium]|nr:MATE family efflux transporter [Lentisphaeria bacterium]
MGAEGRSNVLVEGGLTAGLLRLAGPMFVSALLQNVQSLIDLFWVGRLGSPAVAALAMSGTVLMLLFPMVMGVSSGTVALVSRAVGAGRDDDASDAAGQSLLLALGFGLATGVAGFFLAGWLCRLLGAGPVVAELGRSYLRISFAGSFSVFLLFVGNSTLQGAGRPLLPMCVMALANLLNMALDPLFIFGLFGLPRLEVRGAALATVLSQMLAAAVVLGALAGGRIDGLHVTARRWRFHPHLAWRLLRIGIPSSGQILSRSLMSMVLMRIVASTGMVAVAAYGIGLRFHMIILMPAFTLGNAAATMVGQNLGAGQPARARRAAWQAVAMDEVVMVAAALLLALAARPLIAFFDSTPEVVETGAAYLLTVSPFYVFTGVAIVLGRALMGAGDTVGPMVCTVLCLWGLQVPLALLLAPTMDPPTQGVWWAIAAAAAAHGLVVTAWFETGRWKSKAV